MESIQIIGVKSVEKIKYLDNTFNHNLLCILNMGIQWVIEYVLKCIRRVLNWYGRSQNCGCLLHVLGKNRLIRHGKE